jgi:hypothetical protein
MNNSTVNIPLTKVYIDNKYLGLADGCTEAYWYGITSVPARQFLCHVMLYNGSNWYGLPLASMSTKPSHSGTIAEAQAYDCFSYDISYIRFNFLRDQRAKILSSEGTYLFTIISHDNDGHAPFAEFPEQAKTFTFIALDDGRITCAPNNYITWIDKALYDEDVASQKQYKRLDTVFRSQK